MFNFEGGTIVFFIFYYKELCHNILEQNTVLKTEEKLNLCGKKIE
jgi:hypothetical protein